jgi:hypothetical protein
VRVACAVTLSRASKQPFEHANRIA